MNSRDLPPLYGLVLIGGKSSRMQKDKWSINYHGKSQLEHCFDLLSQYCNKVFVSASLEQIAEKIIPSGFPYIQDALKDRGPMGGILSAMTEHSQVAWLALACDLPLIDHQTIETLCSKRNPSKQATVFCGKDQKQLEPLCAIYEPLILKELQQFAASEKFSLYEALIHTSIEMIELEEQTSLSNVNTTQEYKCASKKIKTLS